MTKILIGTVLGTFAVCGSACADATLSVIGVDANDTLRMRAGPGAGSAEIGRIPPNAEGIEPGAPTDDLDWLSVTYGGVTGFANTHYLAYGARAEQQRLPVRLECVGTEPFWSIEVGYRRAFADLVYVEKSAKLSLSDPEPARGYTNPWLLRASGRNADGFLLISAEQCSDGMSDNQYPYSVEAEIGGTLLKGCCSAGD